jgi:hypothetical protein
MTKIEARAGGVNVVAFLSTVAFSEGTSTHPLTKNAGYCWEQAVLLQTGLTSLEIKLILQQQDNNFMLLL